MIEGVKLIQLKTHADERGFFREILRITDIKSFGQLSWSSMYQGVIKGFHCHAIQYDYWICSIGVIKAVLSDVRDILHPDKSIQYSIDRYFHLNPYGLKHTSTFQEFYLGDNQPAQVLCIPPGVAHGLKVLQGPAHLMYITSQVYNPEDEGRIPHDVLGYDWFKQDIK